MNKKFKFLKILYILFLSNIIHIYAVNNDTEIDSTSIYKKSIKKASYSIRKKPFEAAKVITKSKTYFEKKKDTFNIIYALLHLSTAYQNQGVLNKTFDCLWDGLFLAQQSNNFYFESMLHRRLSDLYHLYKIEKKSLFHVNQSLQASKKIKYIDLDKKNTQLNASYLKMADRNFFLKNYNKALIYLDSCVPLKNNRKNYISALVDAERGYIMLKKGKYDIAHHFLHLSKREQEKLNLNYRAGVYNYLGELKTNIHQPDSALYYFNKSLKIIDQNHLPKDILADVLFNLSKVQVSKNNIKKGYYSLLKAKNITDSITQKINSTNNAFLEIKNSRFEKIREQALLLEKQQTLLKKNKQIQIRLKIILAFFFILFIILLVVIKMKSRLKNTIEAKRNFEIETQLKEEESKSKIITKNKELASYALQLIDKDSSIEELLHTIKEEAPHQYKHLNYKYKKGSNDLWDVFNKRFTQINSDFFKVLEDKHPKLSSTEKKHCALIKLKFSVKEMARILKIEPHSVHVSRSRIRKKIGLNRSENLEKYIENLSI